VKHYATDVDDPDRLFDHALDYVRGLDVGPIAELPDPQKDRDAYFEQEIDALEEAREWAHELMRRIGHPYPGTTGASADEALAEINRYRARMGEPELDPEGAGWSDEDVIAEARRLREIGAIKKRMLSYG
jgi:hypothetical protein